MGICNFLLLFIAALMFYISLAEENTANTALETTRGDNIWSQEDEQAVEINFSNLTRKKKQSNEIETPAKEYTITVHYQ